MSYHNLTFWRHSRAWKLLPCTVTLFEMIKLRNNWTTWSFCHKLSRPRFRWNSWLWRTHHQLLHVGLVTSVSKFTAQAHFANSSEFNVQCFNILWFWQIKRLWNVLPQIMLLHRFGSQWISNRFYFRPRPQYKGKVMFSDISVLLFTGDGRNTLTMFPSSRPGLIQFGGGEGERVPWPRDPTPSPRYIWTNILRMGGGGGWYCLVKSMGRCLIGILYPHRKLIIYYIQIHRNRWRWTFERFGFVQFVIRFVC